MADFNNFGELYSAVTQVIPDAQIEQDMFGQLIIHTNLKEDGNGDLVPYGADDENEDPLKEVPVTVAVPVPALEVDIPENNR